MWVLAQAVPGDDGTQRSFYLCTGQTYTVGRKEEACQILIENDKSISRGHAEMMLTLDGFNPKDVATRPQVVLRDTSVYGTKLNEQALVKSEAVSLNEGDVVQFGVFKSVFRLEWHPLVVCLSKTSPETKKQVRSCLQELGSHFTMALETATHVITETIYPVYVCIGAMLRTIPIVTVDWLSSFTSRPTLRTPPPPTGMFTPSPAPIWAKLAAELQAAPAHASTNLFHENKLRLGLFAGMHFCFIDAEAYAKNHQIVALAKGAVYDASSVDFADRDARNAFFIRHQTHTLIYDDAPGAKGAQAPSAVVRRMGFAVHDQSAIITAVLVASTESLKAKAPAMNALDGAGSFGGQSGWASSVATRLETLPMELTQGTAGVRPSGVGTPGARLPSGVGTPGQRSLSPSRKRTRGSVGPPASVDVKLEDAGAPPSSSKRRKRSASPPPQADAAPGFAARRADPAPAQEEEPPWAPSGLCAAEEGVRMVVAHDPSLFYNAAFPCFRWVAEGGGVGKSFRKQSLDGGLRQGLDRPPVLEAFVNDVVNPQVLLTQHSAEIQYDDLIAVRPQAVKRQAKKAARGANGAVALPGGVTVLPKASRVTALLRSPQRGGGRGAKKPREKKAVIDPFEFNSDDD